MTTFLGPVTSHIDATDYALRLHRIAEQSNSVDAIVTEAARSAVTSIDPAAHAGVSVLVDARSRVHNAVAATTHVPTLFAALENSHHQGPCRDALRSKEVVVVHDFAGDDRWPALRQALEHGASAQSCVIVPMTTATEDIVGALTLYADDTHVFTDTDVAYARSMATFAALAVATVRRSVQFETALASRDVIGQAKGMIMERFTITADEAFCLLIKLSQDSNIRVADIAVRLIGREQAHTVNTVPAHGRNGLTQ